MKKLNHYVSMTSLLGLFMLLVSASIAQTNPFTGVTLTFSPAGGGDDIVVSAQLVDQTYVPSGTINFLESTDYTLTITTSGAAGDNTSTISDNGTQYQFFFGFEDEIFASPGNDGNLAAEDVDPIIYADEDVNGNSIGLITNWTTECGEETTSGTFRMVLRDFADDKSASSDATEGTGIFDISWSVDVSEDPMAPPCENEEETITDVKLTFTPDEGGDPVIVTAQDPDGEGVLDLQIMGEIELLESTDYTLTVELTNSIANEDITTEIMEEDDEHQFFFKFDDEIFASPAGDGNIDNRDDPINYNDFDENGLPLGLSTGWTTECGQETTEGMFRIVLKHQPGVKDSTSTSNDGGTDIDLEWPISVIIDPNAPACENEEETITDVKLTFTPDGGGDPITAAAQDPDGEGVLDLEELDDIVLLQNTTYTLSVELTNSIAGEDITEEIEEEDNEHQFFFKWTEGVFSSPTGDGNIDNRDDPINYLDEDENGLPVGLSTSWTAADGINSGLFRIVLKHQPGVKDSTSTFEDGGTDIDLEFNISTATSVSIDKQIGDNSLLSLYPNPASTTLNWEIENTRINHLEIVSLMGQTVYESTTPENAIAIDQLANGVYFIKLNSENQIWLKKFVIAR
ncbi:MAG: T9SS type A sorting domain-containing protein [Bacteroidota bacterium]